MFLIKICTASWFFFERFSLQRVKTHDHGQQPTIYRLTAHPHIIFVQFCVIFIIFAVKSTKIHKYSMLNNLCWRKWRVGETRAVGQKIYGLQQDIQGCHSPTETKIQPKLRSFTMVFQPFFHFST